MEKGTPRSPFSFISACGQSPGVGHHPMADAYRALPGAACVPDARTTRRPVAADASSHRSGAPLPACHERFHDARHCPCAGHAARADRHPQGAAHGSGAVSYTHLDVYKRQIIGLVITRKRETAPPSTAIPSSTDRSNASTSDTLAATLSLARTGKRPVCNTPAATPAIIVGNTMDKLYPSISGPTPNMRAVNHNLAKAANCEAIVRSDIITSCLFMRAATGSVYCQESLSCHGKNQSPNWPWIASTHTPVSYTHLDVYKRQIMR